MALQRRTHGAATAWSTSQAIPYSTVAAAGDVCYLVALNTAAPSTTITGWTLIASGTANGYSMAIFKKNTVWASGDARPTVSGGTSGGVAWIEHYYSDTAGSSVTEINPVVGLDTTTGSTAFSATGPSSVTTQAADWLVGFMGLKSSATMTANAGSIVLGQSGATLGTAVPRFGARLSGASPTNSLYYNCYTRPVTTGATAAQTFTATGGTGAANVAGPAGLMVLREYVLGTNYNKNQDDALGATDTIDTLIESARQADDPLGMADEAQVVQVLDRGVSDSLGMTDSVTAILGRDALASDSMGLTDSVTVVKTVEAIVADALGLTDSASADAVYSSPSFRASVGDQVSGATTTINLTTPGSVVNNDYGIIVTIQGNGSGNPDTPAGWTLVGNYVSVGGGSNMSVFRRRYQTGDGSPSLFWSSAPGSGNNLSALAFWYSGVTADPTFGTVQATPSAALTAVAPGLTTSGDDRRVVAVSAMKGGGSGFPSSVAFTPNATLRATRYATGNFFGSVGVGDYVKSTAGATGDETATWNYSTVQSFGFLIEFSSQVATAYDKTPADALGMTDSVSAVIGRGASPSDSLGLTDSVSVVVDRTVTLSDGLGIVDTGSPQTIDMTIDQADALGLTDAAVGTIFYVRNISDALGISDAASTDVGNENEQSINDVANLTDSTSIVKGFGRGSSDLVSVSDEVSVDRGKSLVDSLGLTDTVSVAQHYNKVIDDPVELRDSVQFSIVMVRSIADVIGILDSADSTVGSGAGGFYWWDGTALQPMTAMWWDGTTATPMTGIDYAP